jgi:putative transposase
LWNDLIGWHAQARQQHATDPSFRFPTSGEWEKRCQRQYPHLHSQSVQQLISEFLEAVKGCLELRKAGDKEARFPWKQRRFRDVPFTNQGAKLRNGFLLLPNGKAGELAIKLPKGASLPAGRLMEAKLSFGLVQLVFSDEPPPPPRGSDEAKAARAVKSAAAKPPPPVPAVGVDLGVNTLLAATDGERAVVVSGRGVKATVQWRNKRLASLVRAQSSRKNGSRRHKRLQRRKYRVLDKARCRLKDALHKATRQVADAFPGAHVVVGKPFNDAARRLHRTQAQQVSQACTRQAIEMLGYKLASAREVVEAFSSQTCPGCGCRQKCRRTFQCKECGFRAPRDVLGALNILQIGQQGAMAPRASLTVPSIVWTRPSKYPGRKPGSSGGTPARSSAGASSPRSLDL